MLTLDDYIRKARQYGVVSITTEFVNDQHTLITLLEQIYRGQEGVFLLESVEGDEKWGRYSIVGIDAHAFVEVRDKHIVIRTTEDGTEKFIPHEGNPLETLREFMEDYRAADQPELPQFCGGLVGYFAYEAVSFFEKIPHRLKHEPFASFVIPKTFLILDHVKHALTVCVTTFPGEIPSNKRNIEACETLYRNAVAETKRIVSSIYYPYIFSFNEDSEKPSTDLELLPVLAKRQYRRRVEAIKEHVRADDIMRCNFSQPFVSEAVPDPILFYRSMRFSNPSPYLFFMHLRERILVGSSPEPLVRLESRTATLRPTTGKRKRGATEQRDRELADEMLGDSKENAKHLMLVDQARNDLGRVAKTGTVQVDDLMFVERYSNVMHLVSNVTAELEDRFDGFDLFRAVFPSGTFSGVPKVQAMQIIAEQEDSPRGSYGGAAGYIAFNGNIHFAVMGHSAMIYDKKVTTRFGTGIVYDSDPALVGRKTVGKNAEVGRALRKLIDFDIRKGGN